MGYIIILPIPFDILDAAIAENLTYFSDGVLTNVRTPITGASTLYALFQEQLGTFGELRIRKVLSDKSELYVKDVPKLPVRTWTEEEKTQLQAQATRPDKLRVIQEVDKHIRVEHNKLLVRKTVHLKKVTDGLLQRLQSDPFTWPVETHNFASLEALLDEFATSIQAHLRKNFWRSEKEGHKWIPKPEQYAKSLLLTALLSKMGSSALIFEEITSGAGFIDIYVVLPNGEKAVIELKMLGQNYSLGYAVGGISQIHHYVQNREAQAGYLVVFDARTRDFGKGLPSDVSRDGLRIVTKIIDVRPRVKSH